MSQSIISVERLASWRSMVLSCSWCHWSLIRTPHWSQLTLNSELGFSTRPCDTRSYCHARQAIGRHWGHQDGRSRVLEGDHEVGEPGRGLQGGGWSRGTSRRGLPNWCRSAGCRWCSWASGDGILSTILQSQHAHRTLYCLSPLLRVGNARTVRATKGEPNFVNLGSSLEQ